MSIELDMWLILKQAEKEPLEEVFEKHEFEMDYEKEIQKEEKGQTDIEGQEERYFGKDFAKATKEVDNVDEIYGTYKVFPYIDFHGSFRFGINYGDLILKVAHNPKGVTMNKREARLDPDIFPKVYKVSPKYRWILVEKAEKFTDDSFEQYFPELAEYGTMVDLEKYLEHVDFYTFFQKNPEKWKLEMKHSNQYAREDMADTMDYARNMVTNIKPGLHLQKFIDFFQSEENASADVGPRNMGIVTRHEKGKEKGDKVPVLIDAGLHGDMGYRGSKMR